MKRKLNFRIFNVAHMIDNGANYFAHRNDDDVVANGLAVSKANSKQATKLKSKPN